MSKCYMNYNIITNSIDYATVFVDFRRGLICVHVHSTKYKKSMRVIQEIQLMNFQYEDEEILQSVISIKK